MMVRKIFVGLCVSIAMIASAQANVYVAWTASGGFYGPSDPVDGGSDGLLGEGTGNSTIAQLIWSVDAVADVADYSTANYVTGDDVWLATFTITEDGVGGGFDSWAMFAPQTFDDGGAQVAGGYIYARIFQDDSVDLNDWYYDGAVVAASDLDPVGPPADTPQSYDMNRGAHAFGTDEIDDSTWGGQVVPEPTTWALFALGAVVVGLRRRKK